LSSLFSNKDKQKNTLDQDSNISTPIIQTEEMDHIFNQFNNGKIRHSIQQALIAEI
jgi:hypothetical protein